MRQTPLITNKVLLNEPRFRHKLFIESYGVNLCVISNEIAAIDEITKMLPSLLAGNYSLKAKAEAVHEFRYVWNKSGRDSLYKKKEKIATKSRRDDLLHQLGIHIRLTVAEFAIDKVFIHAGVVAIGHKAILIPGTSFSGKTSLVAELIKQGAVYYSDEYAVLDEKGLVHAFNKPLSIRADGEKKQTDIRVDSIGGIVGSDPIPVWMIIYTQFKRGGKWKPKTLSRAKATFELIRNTITIRRAPEFTIAVLDLAIANAIALESNRNEATEVASWIFHQTNV